MLRGVEGAFKGEFTACDLQTLDEIVGAHEQHAPSVLDEREPDGGGQGLLPAATSGCRRQISSKIATARMPGAASNIGTISRSQTPASGSGRRRPRGSFFWDGNRGSASIRYAVAGENPAFAAAMAGALV